MASPSDSVAKTRIINHMNNDHQDSLIRYLEHYARLPSSSARNATLTDISFTSLTIRSSPSKHPHNVPLSPPLTGWADARPRVVAMDQEATAALRRSPISVKKYKPPENAIQLLVFTAAALTFLAFARPANFLPGSLLYRALLWRTPAFAKWCYGIQPLVIAPMVLLHSWEAWYLERTRLRRHTVPRLSRVWWMWVLSTFVEGRGAYIRFDRIVKGEEEKRAKAKH